MFHSLCHNPKNGQYLHHNLYEYCRHSRSRWNVGVNLEPAEEKFDAIEQIDECVMVSTDIFSRLGNLGVKQATLNYKIRRDKPGGERRFQQKLLLLARMPGTGVLGQIFNREDIMIPTRPTPSPSVAENAKRTLIVGISHFANFSSAL